MDKIILKIVTHFPRKDTECCGDYDSRDVFLGDKRLAKLPDSYHDNTHYADGVLDALVWVYGKDNVQLVVEDVADGEIW